MILSIRSLSKVLGKFAPAAVPFSILTYCLYRSPVLAKNRNRLVSFSTAAVSSSGDDLIRVIGTKDGPDTVTPEKLGKLLTFHSEIKGVEDNSSVLLHREDRYDGVLVDPKQMAQIADDSEFTMKLETSVEYWKSKERRGVWLQIPISRASFIPIAVANGFVFHHAEKEYVMMTTWLSGEENRMPPNASHQVGVGCVVQSDDKLLLVQEKNGPLKGTGVWKLPTGLVDLGEDIHEAAIREVMEETGVECEFDRMLCFRQSHGVLHGKSDLFFLCVLRPKTTTITCQESEIQDCQWLSFDTYANQPFYKPGTLYAKINDIIKGMLTEDAVLKSDTDIVSKAPEPRFVASKLPIGFRPGHNVLYHMDSTEVVVESAGKNPAVREIEVL